MRLIVTGATGFAGRHLCEHLRESGHDVVSVGEDGGADLSFDVRDADAVTGAVTAAKPDGILHLAAVAYVPAADSDPGLSDAVNRGGTFNVLDAAAACGARVLVVSSGAVYGRLAAGDLPATEELPLRPQGGYAESKAAAEAECERRRDRQEIVRVRPFNHTGPYQSPDYVCSDFARQIALCEAGRSEPRIAVGDLRAERDFSDVRDVVRAYSAVFERGRPGEAYNVCSGKPRSIASILEVLTGLSRVSVDVDVREDRLRPGEVSRIYGSRAKLDAQCGWEPTFDFERTLSDLLDYWRGEVAGADNRSLRGA